MIRITSLILTAFWISVGAIPTYYATMEYAELKLAAKPMQDKQDLVALGYDIPQFVDSNDYAVIGR